MIGTDTSSTDIFIMYSNKDIEYAREIYHHLNILERNKLCHIWFDEKLFPGDEWQKEIINRINDSDIILILLSPNFIKSNYCYNKEMSLALNLNNKNQIVIIPFLIKACLWQDTPLGKFQLLPNKQIPVSQIKDKNSVYLELTEKLKSIIFRVKFTEALIEGDVELNRGHWVNALNSYTKAHNLYQDGYKPNLIQLSKKIDLCNNELLYISHIKNGDKNYVKGNFIEALEDYNRANSYKNTLEILAKINDSKTRIRNQHTVLSSNRIYLLQICFTLIMLIFLFFVYKPIDAINNKTTDIGNMYLDTYTNNNKFGVTNKDNRIIQLPIYDSIFDYESKYLIFEKNKQWGVLDSAGREIIYPVFKKKKIKQILKCF